MMLNRLRKQKGTALYTCRQGGPAALGRSDPWGWSTSFASGWQGRGGWGCLGFHLLLECAPLPPSSVSWGSHLRQSPPASLAFRVRTWGSGDWHCSPVRQPGSHRAEGPLVGPRAPRERGLASDAGDLASRSSDW